MIIGLFFGLLVGAIAAAIIYWLMRQRLERLLSAIQSTQRRLQQLETDHDRLRSASSRLQTDYERQLAEKIEYYQDDQIIQSELAALDFETRLNVIETAYSRELEAQS